MPVRRVVAVIEAVDKASPTLKKIGASLKTFGAIAAAVGIAALGKSLVDGLISATKAAGEYEGAQVRLAVALANQGENTKEVRKDLLEYARAQQKLSLATEKQIIAGLAQAKTFGASNEVAKELITTATDLASATGVDVDTAIRQVTRTLGGYAGELGELFPQLKQLTQEQLEAGGAAAALATVLQGAGAAGANTYEGALNNLNSTVDQLKVAIGSGLRDVMTGLLNDVITPTIGGLAETEENSEFLRKTVLRTAAGFAEFGASVADVVSGPLGSAVLILLGFGFIKLQKEIALAEQLLEKLGVSGTSVLGDRLRAAAEGYRAAIERGNDAGAGVAESFITMKQPISDITQLLADLGVKGFKKLESDASTVLPLIESLLVNLSSKPVAIPLAFDFVASEAAFTSLLQTQRDLMAEFSEEREVIELQLLERQLERELENTMLTEGGKKATRDKFDLLRAKTEEKFSKGRINLEKREKQQRTQLALSTASSIVGSLQGIFGSNKALSIASAIINTYEGVTNALKHPAGPPTTFILAAATAAFGLAQVAKIRSAKPPTKLQGGGFVPGQLGAGDIVPALLSPGELVLNEAQQAELFGGGGGAPVAIEIELGPNIRALVDEVSVRVRRGAVRLVATELVGDRTVRT